MLVVFFKELLDLLWDRDVAGEDDCPASRRRNLCPVASARTPSMSHTTVSAPG